MTQICTIRSGSTGNSTLLRNRDTSLLIDVGIAYKAIREALCELGDTPPIQGVLITHEHIDHIKGLKTFLKRHPVTLYAGEDVVEYLLMKDMLVPGVEVECIDAGRPFCVGSMQITPFATPHDALQSFGFRFQSGEDTIAFATDLGIVTPQVESSLLGAQMVVLESNYDQRMLESGPYPYYLKRRIMGENGHLSNESCANMLKKLLQTGTKQVVLAHLSRENNLPSLAIENARTTLGQCDGYEEGMMGLFAAPAYEMLKPLCV